MARRSPSTRFQCVLACIEKHIRHIHNQATGAFSRLQNLIQLLQESSSRLFFLLLGLLRHTARLLCLYLRLLCLRLSYLLLGERSGFGCFRIRARAFGLSLGLLGAPPFLLCLLTFPDLAFSLNSGLSFATLRLFGL